MSRGIGGSRTDQPRILSIYVLISLFGIIAIGVYYWAAYHQPLPGALAGTPADPFTFMSEADVRRSSDYSAVRDTLFFAGYFMEWGIWLWLLTSGTARTLADKAGSKLPSWIRFVCYIAAMGGLYFLIVLPLRLLSFALSKHYDISVTPPAVWFRDQAVALGLDIVLLIAGSGAVLFLIRRGGAWWLKLWLLSVPFLLFMMYVRPIAVDPLFYEYRPLQDAHLKASILELTEQAGIPTERIFEANYSEKTNAINAYVDGIGPSLRIVIWDTALQKLNEEEILVLTAHEIAHYVMNHLQWSAAGSILGAFVLLWIGSRLYQYVLERWRKPLHIRHASDWAAVPLLMLILSLLTFASTPVAAAISRHAEMTADRYAYELTGKPEAAVTMYQKLAISSKGPLYPPALTYWFRYTHPSTGMRIEEALKVGHSSP